MLIQSPQHAHTPYYSGAENSANATGVNQSSARAAIPPVEASGKEEAAQNQFFNTRGAVQGQVEVAAGAQEEPKPAEGVTSKPVEQESVEKKNAEAQRQLEQQQELEDQLVVDQLKARDREVRVHEAAHAAVGGQYAGAPSLEYTRGPDGKNYATGGEVSISVSEASDPQATIEKARVIQAAALAPAQPSSQDRQVAAQAARMELNAQVELQQQKSAETDAKKRSEDKEVNDSGKAVESPETASESQASPINSYQQTGQLASTDSGATDTDSAKHAAGSAQGGGTANGHSNPVSTYIKQFHQQGPSDLQNPYGKSGQLNVLA